jgi:hypothetical protein
MRVTVRALPQQDELMLTPAGYGCSFSPQSGIFTEEIRRAGDKIAENSVAGVLGQPWSEVRIRRFLSDNGIAGSPFSCWHLARAIGKGSLETLSTTLVRAR